MRDIPFDGLLIGTRKIVADWRFRDTRLFKLRCHVLCGLVINPCLRADDELSCT